MMNLRHVQAFCAIARLGSFNAAAKALSTTQPSISMRIRELERELGTQLFDTSNRRARLTPKGLEFIPHAEELLRLVDHISAKMTDRKAISGTIRLGASETIAMTWLSSFVETMKRKHPKVLLAVEIDVAGGLWKRFRSGLLDAVIVSPPPREPGIYTEPLGEFEYRWMASPSMGIPQRTLSPMELAIHPIISLSESSALFQMTVNWLGQNGATPDWTNHCSNLGMVTALTEAGLGISLLPASLMAKQIEAGKLHLIDVAPSFPRLDFAVVYGEHAVSAALRAAVAQMRETSTFKIAERPLVHHVPMTD